MNRVLYRLGYLFGILHLKFLFVEILKRFEAHCIGRWQRLFKLRLFPTISKDNKTLFAPIFRVLYFLILVPFPV